MSRDDPRPGEPFGKADNVDVAIMQTAASLENLAVGTYASALDLPFMASVPPALRVFATKTKDQHAEHAKAFNAAATRLGGKLQDKPDPVMAKVVEEARPGLRTPLDVVELAIKLETAAAQTYVANTVALADIESRKLVASVTGVAAQHLAILNAVKALLQANAPQLINFSPETRSLPAAVGSVGFPDALLRTDQARPNDEGAVR